MAWWGYGWYGAAGPLPRPTVLVVSKGVGSEGIGRQLADAGIVSHPSLFALAARLTRSDGELKAGEYAFPAGISPESALALLRSGRGWWCIT